MAVMCLAAATGMERSSRGRQGQRGQVSDEREEQQQSCIQAMHGPWVFEAYQLAVDESKKEAARGWVTPAVEKLLRPGRRGDARDPSTTQMLALGAQASAPLRMTDQGRTRS